MKIDGYGRYISRFVEFGSKMTNLGKKRKIQKSQKLLFLRFLRPLTNFARSAEFGTDEFKAREARRRILVDLNKASKPIGITPVMNTSHTIPDSF